MPGTVTVACALPHGFVLQLQEKVAIPAPSLTDPNRREEISRYGGRSIKINGPAVNRDAARVLDGTGVQTQGGYALTPNVDKDTWEKWREQMKDWPPLVAGQIFANEREDNVRGEARSGKHGPSGFEPFTPSKPPDEFKSRNGKSLIETAEKQ